MSRKKRRCRGRELGVRLVVPVGGGGLSARLARILEVVRLQSVSGQKLVEIGSSALGKAGGLSHVAGGALQVVGEIIAREFIPRLVVARNHRRVPAQGLLDEFLAHDVSVREGAVLLYQLEELPHVPRPVRGRQQFDGLGRIYFSLAAWLRRLFQEMRYQQRNVLASTAERRHFNRQNADLVVQIPKKLAGIQ